jgi:hypothetical protein
MFGVVTIDSVARRICARPKSLCGTVPRNNAALLSLSRP